MAFPASNRFYATVGGSVIALILVIVILVCVFMSSDDGYKYADQRTALAKQLQFLANNETNVYLWKTQQPGYEANFTFFNVNDKVYFYMETSQILQPMMANMFVHEQNKEMQLAFNKNGDNQCYSVTENVFQVLKEVDSIENWLKTGEINEKSDSKGFTWEFTGTNFTINFQFDQDKKTVSIDDIQDQSLEYTITQYTEDFDPLVFNKEQVEKACSNDPMYDVKSNNPLDIARDFLKNHQKTTKSTNSDTDSKPNTVEMSKMPVSL